MNMLDTLEDKQLGNAIDEGVSHSTNIENRWILTPLIITLCEAHLTVVDIQSFIEAGLKTVRFRIQITKEVKMKLLSMLKTAMGWCCEKYDIATWPLALSIDIPNACIKTGIIYNESTVDLLEHKIITLTSDEKFNDMVTADRIYIDDPYALEAIKPGTEVSIDFGKIIMICTEVIDNETVKCEIIRGGKISNEELVCIRGIKHLKPPLGPKDVEMILFARSIEADIITVHSIRYPSTLNKIRSFFPEDKMPLIVCSICEQEGLDNIDAIIEKSDGIILAREFMAYEILNINQMTAIQLNISAKCRKAGKPFYISGNILQMTVQKGKLLACDLNDVTNAVLQKAGFVLRDYKKQSNLIKAMNILNSICKAVEPFVKHDFWRLYTEYKLPVNAADAAIVASALLAKQSGSSVIIVLTVTGKTAKRLAHISESIILTISSKPRVARQLQLYRGITTIIYEKESMSNWYDEVNARIQFAVTFALKNDILAYGMKYVTLKKTHSTSSFCDHASVWTVSDSSLRRDEKCANFSGSTLW